MEDQLVGLLLFLLALVIATAAWLIRREIGRFDKLPRRLERLESGHARQEASIQAIMRRLKMEPTILPIDDSITEDSA